MKSAVFGWTLSSLCRVTCAVQIRGWRFSWNFMTIASALDRTINRTEIWFNPSVNIGRLYEIIRSPECFVCNFHSKYIYNGIVIHDDFETYLRAKWITRGLYLLEIFWYPIVCNCYRNRITRIGYYIHVRQNDKLNQSLEVYIIGSWVNTQWFWSKSLSKVKSKRTLLAGNFLIIQLYAILI